MALGGRQPAPARRSAGEPGRSIQGTSFRLLLIPDLEQLPRERVLLRLQEWAEGARPFSVMVDLRAKSWPARRLLGLAEELALVLRQRQQGVAISERLDIAELVQADLLHLGEHSAPSERVRASFARPLLRACHAPEQAGLVDAELVLLSPIWAARKGNAALGLAGLVAARSSIERQASGAALVALGGIDASNAAACLEAGASAVAVMGAFESAEPKALLAALSIAR